MLQYLLGYFADLSDHQLGPDVHRRRPQQVTVVQFLSPQGSDETTPGDYEQGSPAPTVALLASGQQGTSGTIRHHRLRNSFLQSEVQPTSIKGCQ